VKSSDAKSCVEKSSVDKSNVATASNVKIGDHKKPGSKRQQSK
jgi:hypothetical protein